MNLVTVPSCFRLPATVVVAGAALATALVAVAGCGSGSSETRRTPLALMISDRSTSFKTFSAACVTDFMRVAEVTAEQGGDLYGGALVADDPFGASILVEKHFGDPAPPGVAGNDELERAHRRREARKLRPELVALTRMRARGGSPILETLERAGRFVTQRARKNAPVWIVMCSDLANVGDILDVRRPISRGQMDRAIEQWIPRLTTLRGTDLYFVGAGRRTRRTDSRPDSIRRFQGVVQELAAGVGARVRLIDTQLGQTFPLDG